MWCNNNASASNVELNTIFYNTINRISTDLNPFIRRNQVIRIITQYQASAKRWTTNNYKQSHTVVPLSQDISEVFAICSNRHYGVCTVRGLYNMVCKEIELLKLNITKAYHLIQLFSIFNIQDLSDIDFDQQQEFDYLSAK